MKKKAIIYSYLKTIVDRNGSDLYLTVGVPATIKATGEFTQLKEKVAEG